MQWMITYGLRPESTWRGYDENAAGLLATFAKWAPPDGVEIVATIYEGRHVGIRLDGWFLRKDVRRNLLGLWRDSVFPDAVIA